MSEFRHTALFYHSLDEYLSGTIPFVWEAQAAGRPVVVAVPAPRLEAVRRALGEAVRDVTMIDMSVAGRNPGRIIPSVLRAFADDHPQDDPYLVGEPIWHGRTEAEYPACAQHEALINLAFRGRRATILCPYDARRLSARSLADAERTHPFLQDTDGVRKSPRYAPEQVVADYNLPLPRPIRAPHILPFHKPTLQDVREFTLAETRRAGLDHERAGDAELAVNELAANSVRHGGGKGLLRIWRQYGQVVCEVSDAGLLIDPLAGRRPAGDSHRGGRGLLLVNLLADLVRVHTGPEGTTTRAYFRRA